MPEIQPTGAPYPRTVLGWDGTDWRVVAVDGLGRLQMDVLSNANLDGALQSVGTDRLNVRGEDQLFSYKEEYIWAVKALAVGAGHQVLDSNVVAGGEARVLTNVIAYNDVTVNTYMYLATRRGIVNWQFSRTMSPVIGEGLQWSGHIYLPAGDLIRAYFRDCVANDNLYMFLHGYEMTLEV